MKNLIYVIGLVALILGFQSCDSCSTHSQTTNGEKLIYNVTATAEGEVEFAWFNGGAKINGEAEVHQCNDTLNLLKSNEDSAISLSSALNSPDSTVSETAEIVSSMLQVEGVEGNYHLAVKGYVKYGPMMFLIDEEYPKDSI